MVEVVTLPNKFHLKCVDTTNPLENLTASGQRLDIIVVFNVGNLV